MTIAMDDQFLNGTNRVVLDGVMTEKECERILYLANVSSEQERPFGSKTLCTHTLARFPACFRQAAGSAGDGYKGRRSPHTPHETFEGLTVLRAAKVGEYEIADYTTLNELNEISVRIKRHIMYFRCSVGIFFKAQP